MASVNSSDSVRGPSRRGVLDSPRLWLFPAPLLAFALLATAWLTLRPGTNDSDDPVPVRRAVVESTAAPVITADARVYSVASADPGYGLYRDADGAFLDGWRVGSRAIWKGAPAPGRYEVSVAHHYAAGLGETPARLGVRVGTQKAASYLTLSEAGAPARHINLGEIEVTSASDSVELELIEGPSDSTRLRVGPISFIPLTRTR